jgi:hypothetical protein
MRRLLSRLLRKAPEVLIEERVAARFARAAATAAARNFVLTNPLSWEFGGFSQHGEDGIIDTLCGMIQSPDRFFLEIGSADASKTPARGWLWGGATVG